MISVIVITFNSEKFIGACLDSVFRQDCPGLKVIVIDNGSQDNTRNIIKRSYPQASLIINEDNLGSCRARNQGIELSCSEWVLCLDCDTILEDNFFIEANKIISFAEPDLGMFQPKILKYDKKTIFSCGLHLSWFRRFRDLGRNKVDCGKYNFPKHIFGASSACVFYRRKMLEDIKENTGYFDQRFFFLVEDVDLSWRANNKGWKACLFPNLKCYHVSDSCGLNKKIRQFFCFRNRYYSIAKNEGIPKYLVKILPALFYDLPRILFLLLTNPYVYNYPINKKAQKMHENSISSTHCLS
ncbi:MAG: glycosyltransferase family 2 protein [Candidatus Omnitrophota bacterium]